MKEPQKIPLNPDNPKTKQVSLIRLEPLIEHLYDEYGYLTTIKIQNENSQESTET